MGKLESGVQIPESEITTLYGEIMQLIKAKLNEKQRKKFAEQTL